MEKRKALSKKVRFTVFERDDFVCQYCGKNPRDNDIVLHVDHIVSVYDGGDNHTDNLITSCISCNLGKGKKSVVIKPKTKKELEVKIQQSEERLAQVKMMYEARQKIRATEDEIQSIKYGFIPEIFDGYSDKLLDSVGSFVSKREASGISLDMIEESLQISIDKFSQKDSFYAADLLKYTNGIIRNKINNQE